MNIYEYDVNGGKTYILLPTTGTIPSVPPWWDVFILQQQPFIFFIIIIYYIIIIIITLFYHFIVVGCMAVGSLSCVVVLLCILLSCSYIIICCFFFSFFSQEEARETSRAPHIHNNIIICYVLNIEYIIIWVNTFFISWLIIHCLLTHDIIYIYHSSSWFGNFFSMFRMKFVYVCSTASTLRPTYVSNIEIASS